MRKTLSLALFALAALAACGDRPDVWNRTSSPSDTFIRGMKSGVAFVDGGARRVILASPTADGDLDRAYLPVGKNVSSATVSIDGERLFVLSRGELPRRTTADERASLTLIGNDRTSRRFELDAPLSSIVLDPKGRYVALLPASSTSGTVATTAFVENPNQFVVIDLEAPAGQEISARTLRSFGGRIQRATFTDALTVGPEGKRFLVLESSEDVSLLDLGHLHDGAAGRPEVTVRLTSGTTTRTVTPAGIIFDDGDPAKNDDATIAVRPQNDSNVVVLTLAPQPATADAANDFSVRVNLVDAGGIVSDLAFVRTDAGRRIAALVPTIRRGVLIEQETSVITSVDLPDAYSRLALVGAGSNADTAILYGAPTGIAFWSLAQTSATPYRSIETLTVPGGASSLYDVPQSLGDIKIISAQSRSEFYVLNLRNKTAAPLATSTVASLYVAPNMMTPRVWAFTPGTTSVAQLPLDSLSPVAVPLPRAADALFEVASPSGPALLAVSSANAGTTMVVNADAPQNRNIVVHEGLLLEGLTEAP